MVEVHKAAAGFRRKPSCGQSLPASGSFEGPALWLDHAETGDPSLLGTCLPVPQRPCSCLSTFQHTARIGDVCNKLDIKFTIELDRALADRLNPARDDWQQIYKLLKAQKKPRSNWIAVMVGSSWFRGTQLPLLASEFCEFAVSTILRVQAYLSPHDWVAAMPVTSAAQDSTEVRYFFDWVPLI